MMENPYAKKNQNYSPPHPPPPPPPMNLLHPPASSSKETPDRPDAAAPRPLPPIILDPSPTSTVAQQKKVDQDVVSSLANADTTTICTTPSDSSSAQRRDSNLLSHLITAAMVVSAEQPLAIAATIKIGQQPSPPLLTLHTQDITHQPEIRNLNKQLQAAQEEEEEKEKKIVLPQPPDKKKEVMKKGKPLSLRQEVALLKEQHRLREKQLQAAKQEKKRRRQLQQQQAADERQVQIQAFVDEPASSLLLLSQQQQRKITAVQAAFSSLPPPPQPPAPHLLSRAASAAPHAPPQRQQEEEKQQQQVRHKRKQYPHDSFLPYFSNEPGRHLSIIGDTNQEEPPHKQRRVTFSLSPSTVMPIRMPGPSSPAAAAIHESTTTNAAGPVVVTAPPTTVASLEGSSSSFHDLGASHPESAAAANQDMVVFHDAAMGPPATAHHDHDPRLTPAPPDAVGSNQPPPAGTPVNDDDTTTTMQRNDDNARDHYYHPQQQQQQHLWHAQQQQQQQLWQEQQQQHLWHAHQQQQLYWQQQQQQALHWQQQAHHHRQQQYDVLPPPPQQFQPHQPPHHYYHHLQSAMPAQQQHHDPAAMPYHQYYHHPAPYNTQQPAAPLLYGHPQLWMAMPPPSQYYHGQQEPGHDHHHHHKQGTYSNQESSEPPPSQQHSEGVPSNSPVLSNASPNKVVSTENTSSITAVAFEDQFLLHGNAVARFTPPKPKTTKETPPSLSIKKDRKSNQRTFSSPIMADLKAGPMPEQDRLKVHQTIIQACLNPKRSLPTDLLWMVAEECARMGYRSCPEVWPKWTSPAQPSTLARLHEARSDLPTMQACRCGSSSHRRVSYLGCPLFAQAQQLSLAKTSSSSSNTQVKKAETKTGGVVLQAMVERSQRKKLDDEEYDFIHRMEMVELQELGRAAKAPLSLSTMVLVASLQAEVAEPDDDDDDDDDEIFLADLGQLSRELCTSIVRFIAKRWGHCYREPSHVEHSWRWQVDNPREPGTRTFDALPPDGSLLEFAIHSGVVDELCQLIKSKVLRFDGRQLTKDWIAHVERAILDDAFVAATEALYGVPATIHQPILSRWQRKDHGWYLGNCLVHKDEWKDSFVNSYQQYRNDEAGIDKFL